MRSPALRVPREQIGIDRNDPTLVFYAPLWHPDLKSSPFYSMDLNRHVCTVTGATPGSQGRTFASGNFIESSNAGTTALDFTTSAFTISMWVKSTDLTTTHLLLCRGKVTLDGYEIWVDVSKRLNFRTNQAGASQISYTTTDFLTTGGFYFFNIVRDGAVATLYIDNVAKNEQSGVHINPLTSARKLLLGIWDTETDYPFVGTMGEVQVYNRALSASEITNNYLATKWRYQ